MNLAELRLSGPYCEYSFRKPLAMRRSAKMIVLSRLGVLLVLLITMTTGLGGKNAGFQGIQTFTNNIFIHSDQSTCDQRYKLSNCRNNELNYEVEMDGPYGDKFIVEQKIRRVPNERTLASRLSSQRTPFRDWIGSVFPTMRPNPLRQFMNGGRQRSSRTAAGTNRRARANRRARPRQGRAGLRRAARRNQRV